MGIDSEKPQFSWKLRDSRAGARQTAYEILVASHPGPTASADVWDSGRIASDTSVQVPYAGSPLAPSSRYYWRVKVWDKDGKAYPVSAVEWWETGLLNEEWKAQWIGHEPAELHSVRGSGAEWISNPEVRGFKTIGDTHHDFRLGFDLDGPIKRAILYVTGEDTVAAWANGKQQLEAQPMPPWGHSPWGTYRQKDVTTALHDGRNILAVMVTSYDMSGGTKPAASTQAPMSMCLYVEMADGKTRLVTSSKEGWRASLNAEGDWQSEKFNDRDWKHALLYVAEGRDTKPGRPWPTGPVAIVRRDFVETAPIVSARLYATALGAYKFHLNGKPVGDQLLAPGWMDFREHVPYQVYDVTRQVVTGKNALTALIAPGWYSTPLMWLGQGNNYGDTQPAVKAQLRIEHAGGSVEWITTDDSWKADISATSLAEIYNGETYDARAVKPGWDTAVFDDAQWTNATVVNPKPLRIVPQYFQPIREERVMKAKSISSPGPGVYIYDFGQNMAAVPRVSIAGKPGEQIRLRFAEVLNSDGTMYVENLRSAKATDYFTLAGTGSPEDFQPQFTFHGFRYLEVTGVSHKPTLETVEAVVLHTDAPFTTRLVTGSDMVNKLYSNILWGQRSNFVGLPTDCPQRDERLGWSADAQVFWRTAAYNMDLTAFSKKFAGDLRGTQLTSPMYGFFAPGTTTPNPGFGPGWSDAGVIIPWTGWLQSGDTRIIEENWSGMEAYLKHIQDHNPNGLWQNEVGTPFGDWLTPTITTPEDLVATAYWAYDVTLMKQMAEATGRKSDALKYGEAFDHIKAAFIKAYVHDDGFVGATNAYPAMMNKPDPPVKDNPDGSKPLVETQTGYVLALYMNLVPEELRTAAADKLIAKIKANNWMLGTGFLGTPYLMAILSETGHSDIAYKLLMNREYPSWGYVIDNGGTTTWERWNGDKMRNDPSMNSYNHYAYGAVGEWIYRYAAGVDTSANGAGFRQIILHPNFDSRLGSIDFSYDSPYGEILSSWKVNAENVAWSVTVPPNTTALLPTRQTNGKEYQFQLDRVSLQENKRIHAKGNGSYELPPGTYTFNVSLQSASSHAGAR